MMATFTSVWIALYVAHVVADHWVQTEYQALHKGDQGDHSWRGRLAAARHVVTYTLVAALSVALVAWRLELPLDATRVGLGLGVSALTHYWADRRWTLVLLAERIGKRGFLSLGGPLGGAYLLDQSWHVAWLLAAALVIV
jgi:hypothetical protein